MAAREEANAESSSSSSEEEAASRKVTRPIMSKYELSRALSVRAQQIMNGAEPHVDPGSETNAFKIAQLELRNKKLHLCSRRALLFTDWLR